MNVFRVIWLISAITGVVASVAGIAVRSLRYRALFVAAVLFVVAGLLGLASIGVVFLLLALAAAIGAGRSKVNEGGDLV